MSDRSDPVALPELEIAHVLFMDLVGYSALPLEEQPRTLAELRDVVRHTAEFRRMEASGALICLPTGDGMALAFFRDPVAPVQCAMQIARSVRAHPHLTLRMGMNSGPVYRVEDINTNLNVSGGGINLAQRVMDCGDAGHILLSSAIVELLGQVGAWPLHSLGECEIKHGKKLHLYNLCTDEVGNPHRPQRLGREPVAARAGGDGSPAESAAAARGDPTLPRVAILYKRNARPDEELLGVLESELKAQGFAVFVDRHLGIGVEWAQEIERQVRTADAVIPLVSAVSALSEMMTYEVQIAHEAFQRVGKPRILPVRVQHTGPLPSELASALDPLHYVAWESAGDNQRLVAELVHALRTPPAELARAALEPVGGAVPLESQFYIVRKTDEEFRAAIARRDSIVLVKGARQMGKTSLLARGLQQAREAGARIVLTDFQKLNLIHLQSADQLYRALAGWLADQLDLDVTPASGWSADRGPNMNFERFLRREVLGRMDATLVWGLDEVDRLFTCDFGTEVFALFRSWHNERSLDPAGPWSRLTLAIAYATEAHLFITDMNQSPFNVGTRLTLDDFTLPQVAELNRRYGHPLRDEDEVARLFGLVSGHPYLVRRGLQELVTQQLDLAAFESQADRDEGIFGDHLRRMLVLLARDPELTQVLRGLLRRQPLPTTESFYRLRSAGVIAGDGVDEARPRCQVYANYLGRHLL